MSPTTRLWSPRRDCDIATHFRGNQAACESLSRRRVVSLIARRSVPPKKHDSRNCPPLRQGAKRRSQR